MKKLLLLSLFLITTITQAQQTWPKLRPNTRIVFSGTAGTSLNGVSKFISYPSGSPVDSTPIYNSSGTAIQGNNALGSPHYSTVVWDSVFSNSGNDSLVIGFTPTQKSRYNSDIAVGTNTYEWAIYLLMNGTSATWSGTKVTFTPWDNGRYEIRAQDVSNGVASAPSAPWQGGNNANQVPGNWTSSVNDTFWLSIKGSSAILYRTNATNGTGSYGIGTLSLNSSGRFALEMRVDAAGDQINNGNPPATGPTLISSMILASAPPPPLVPSTVDTTNPVIVAYGTDKSNIDTSKPFNLFFHARDNDTISQYRPKLKQLAIRLFLTNGTPVDSMIVNMNSRDTTIIMPGGLGIKRPQGSYHATFTAIDSSNNDTTVTQDFPVGTAPKGWATAYYDVWQMNPLGSSWWAEPPAQINWNGIGLTHIIQFPNHNIELTAPPYFGPVSGVDLEDSLDTRWGTGRPNPDYRDQLISLAHAKNIKVLLCINAVDAYTLDSLLDFNYNRIVDLPFDSLRADTLCAGVAAYLSRHGYDGVDINIEHGSASRRRNGENFAPFPTKAHISLLIRRMRHFLSLYSAGLGGNMTLTLSPTSGDQANYDAAVCNANVDQINPQTYDNQYAWNEAAGGNAMWFSDNLYRPSNAQLAAVGSSTANFGNGNLVHNISEHGPSLWFNAGFNKTILGVGISSYGRLRFNPAITTTPNFANTFAGDPPGTPGGTNGDGYAATQPAIISGLLNNGGTLMPYDTVTKSQQIVGTAILTQTYNGTGARVVAGRGFYFTYPTPRVVQDIADWITSNGYSGMMIFDMQMDVDPANSNPDLRNPIVQAAGQAMGGTPLAPSPNPPTLLTPANGITGQPLTGVVFTWAAVTGATNYNFQLSASSDMSNPMADINTAGTTLTSGQNPLNLTLQQGTPYYWRVNVTTSTGTSSYATPFSFTTLISTTNPPGIPILVSPTNHASPGTTTIAFTIQLNVTDTVTATIFQVSRDTTSANLDWADSSGANLTKTMPFGATPGVKYYWRAALKNSAGRGQNSVWYDFTVSISAPRRPQPRMFPWVDPITKQIRIDGLTDGTDVLMVAPSNLHRPDSINGGITWGPLGFKRFNNTFETYALVSQLPTFSINAIAPLIWSSSSNTLSMNVVSATQDGYATSAMFSLWNTAANKLGFNWRVAGGSPDSSRIIFTGGVQRLGGDTLFIPGAIDSLDNSWDFEEDFDAGFITEAFTSGARSAQGKEAGTHGWAAAGFGGRSGNVATMGTASYNTAITDGDFGGTYIAADSARQYHSNGLSCGIWIGPNVHDWNAMVYTIPTGTIMKMSFITPSSVDSQSFHMGMVDGAIQLAPFSLMDSVRTFIGVRIGNKTGTPDSLYGVTCDATPGSTASSSSNRVLVGLIAAPTASTVYKVVAVYRGTSVDWYVNNIYRRTSTSHVPTTSQHGWAPMVSASNYSSKISQTWTLRYFKAHGPNVLK